MKNECLRLIGNSERENSKDLLIEKMNKLVYYMQDVAVDMEYLGGFNGEMVKHSKELMEAGIVLLSWIDGIENKKDVTYV